MNLEKEVLELIEFIKQKMSEMEDQDYRDASKVFLNGNCGNLYELFCKKFSKYATPFLITYREEPYHIVTKIGKYMYDITGRTDLISYINYIREHNYDYRNAPASEFQIEELSVIDPRLDKMKNMYNYGKNIDLQWNRSYSQEENIEVMKKLYYQVDRFEQKSR